MLDRIADALGPRARSCSRARRLARRGGRGAGRARRRDGALTASSALGRGVFPDQRFDLGVTGGFGAEGAMELIREADVAVVFGASLNQFTMRFGALFAPGTQVFRSTSRPRRRTRTSAASCGPTRGSRRGAGRPAAGRDGSGWREGVDVVAARAYEPGDEAAPDGRLDPRSAARRIAELLPEDRVVVSDGGHFIGWANMYWPVASPDRMMMIGTAFQAIGQGGPASWAPRAPARGDRRAHLRRRRRPHGDRRSGVGRAPAGGRGSP
jgi:thiamine pyrophosphate-dependent acetolactate synthase large subunit-like protein